MAKIEVGDTVRMTGKFLRNTGQQVGGEGKKRWTVRGISGSFAIVDEEADTSYFTAEEMAADPSLKWRRINVGNLEKVKGPSAQKHESGGNPRVGEAMEWSESAGGTGAFDPSHHGYSARGWFGEYHVWPPQRRGAGYSLKWANTSGQSAPHSGLWHDLGSYRSPQSAKGAAQRHARSLKVLAARHESGGNPKVSGMRIVSTKEGSMSGGLWHTVEARIGKKLYTIKVHEEARGLRPHAVEILGPSGRNLPRGTKLQAELAFKAQDLVRAREGYTGLSESEERRETDAFVYRDVDLGGGFVVKYHKGTERWIIYYNGKNTGAGGSFHGAPGFEKLSEAIERGKKIKADTEQMHRDTASLKHEKGGNPRVGRKNFKTALAETMERDRLQKEHERQAMDRVVAEVTESIRESVRRGEQPHIKTEEDIVRAGELFGRARYMEEKRAGLHESGGNPRVYRPKKKRRSPSKKKGKPRKRAAGGSSPRAISATLKARMERALGSRR